MALAAIPLLWGYNWVIMKESLQYCNPFIFSALRTFFASFILFFLLYRETGSIMPKNITLLIFTGLFTTGGGVGVAIWALNNGGAGKTAVLVWTMPFWILILAWPILSEKIRGLRWIVVGLASSGLTLILAPWNVTLDLFGSLLAVLAGFMMGFGAILVKIMRKKGDFDIMSVTAWQFFFGGIPIGIVAVFIPTQPTQWTPTLIGGLTYNIVFAAALANLFWFYCLKHLPAGTVGMSMMAVPVIGVVSAALKLGEKPLPLEIFGMVLILCSIILLSVLDLRVRQNT